jgi:hypothetical protein
MFSCDGTTMKTKTYLVALKTGGNHGPGLQTAREATLNADFEK